jgi:hypothetical protein
MLQMKPAEVITVRRPSGTSTVDTFRFFTSDVPPTWEELELQDGGSISVPDRSRKNLTRLDEKAKGVERVSVRISSWPYERTRQAQ